MKQPHERLMESINDGVTSWEEFGRACMACLSVDMLNDIAREEFGIDDEEEEEQDEEEEQE